MSKKILPAVLILLLVFNTFGLELLFQIMLGGYKEIAKEIFRDLSSEDDLIFIEVSQNNLSDIIELNESEILYKRERYDLYKIIKRKRSVVYCCIKDAAEQNLIDIYFGKGEGKRMNPGAEINFNLEKIYLNPCKINLDLIEYSKNLFLIFRNFYKEPAQKVELRPPKSNHFC